MVCRGLVLLASVCCGMPLATAGMVLEFTDKVDFVSGLARAAATIGFTYPYVLAFPGDLLRTHAAVLACGFGPDS